MAAPEASEIVQLITASNPQEAHLWRQALADEGICCRVVGDYLGGIVAPGYPVPELWVREEDSARAQQILDGMRKSSHR